MSTRILCDLARLLRRTALAGASAGLALGLTAGCASGANQSGVTINAPSPSTGYRGFVLDGRYTEPDVTLTDTSGRSFNLETDTRKPITLVFFGYTHCPDVCPTTLADVTSALRRVPPDTRDKVQFVFVTTDPNRDTPEVLREYLGRFDDSYIGLTGSLDTIKQAARHLGVALTGTTKLPGGGYEVEHGSQVIAFGGDGRARLLWLEGTTVGDYKHDIARLARTTVDRG